MTYDLAPEEPTAPPEPNVPELDDRLRLKRKRSAVIETDLPCIRCGYNLRTQRRRGRCPECGAAVVVSEAGDDLIHASPEWLRIVRRGLALLLWFVGLAAAQVFLQWPALALVQQFLALVGVLLITTPEPRDRVEDSAAGLRNGLRLAVALLCGAAVLGAAGQWAGANSTVLAVVGVLSSLLFVGVIIGLSYYLARLARRMEDVDLERQTVTVMWGLIGAVVAVGVFVPLLNVLPVASQGPAFCGSVVASLALVGLLLWFLNLLFRYHGVIRWVAYEAQYRLDEERAK